MPPTRYVAAYCSRYKPLKEMRMNSRAFLMLCSSSLLSREKSSNVYSLSTQALFSVVLSAYFSSFIIAAAVMLHKRLTTPSSNIPWGPFRLGAAGVPITIVAIAYSIVGMFFSMWPPFVDVTPSTMNYSSLVFGGALLISVAFWVGHGRKVYVGPIWEY